jgi:RNA polymerase sigma-70 factor (ECF subfamily)
MTPFRENPHSHSPKKALGLLIEKYGNLIFNLGLKICRNREDAEDLVQETFLRAFCKWDQFEGRSEPSTWLYTIATRICKRMHRLHSGEPKYVLSLSKPFHRDEKGGFLDVTSPREGPLDEVVRKEVREIVDTTISTLPFHLRLPLVFKDIAQLSIEKIACILELKEATVKSRVHRARLILREELTKRLPKRGSFISLHSEQICLDLLRAKQEAMDRNIDMPLPPDVVCVRCHNLFLTMDLSKEACCNIARGELPKEIKKIILEKIGTQ